MHIWILRSALIMGCLAFLAGCGVTYVGSSTSHSAGNTSPATRSPGPVAIITDHTAYAPTDLIQVTLTNDLAQSLFAYDHQASCSIFTLEQAVQGIWQPLTKPLAGCPLGSPTRQIQVAPGAEYRASIRAGYLRQGDAGFPAGQYRLLLSYTTTPQTLGDGAPPPTDATPTATTLFSATLTIDPSVPPEPLPTIPASGSGSGTAIAGTVVSIGTVSP